MEDPHKRKVNLNTSTYLIKKDDEHFHVRKILFTAESNLAIVLSCWCTYYSLKRLKINRTNDQVSSLK